MFITLNEESKVDRRCREIFVWVYFLSNRKDS